MKIYIYQVVESWHYSKGIWSISGNLFLLVSFILNGVDRFRRNGKGTDMYTFLFFPFITHPIFSEEWQISPAPQRGQVHLKLKAGNPGYKWLLKGSLLWAIGQLFPWRGDAIFLGGDHFMLLSMFNLYSKAVSSKWQTPAEPSVRSVNQKPYEILGISILSVFVSPGKESPVPFRFQSSLQAPCLELPPVAHLYLTIVYIRSPRPQTDAS